METKKISSKKFWFIIRILILVGMIYISLSLIGDKTLLERLSGVSLSLTAWILVMATISNRVVGNNFHKYEVGVDTRLERDLKRGGFILFLLELIHIIFYISTLGENAEMLRLGYVILVGSVYVVAVFLLIKIFKVYKPL